MFNHLELLFSAIFYYASLTKYHLTFLRSKSRCATHLFRKASFLNLNILLIFRKIFCFVFYKFSQRDGLMQLAIKVNEWKIIEDQKVL